MVAVKYPTDNRAEVALVLRHYAAVIESLPPESQVDLSLSRDPVEIDSDGPYRKYRPSNSWRLRLDVTEVPKVSREAKRGLVG